MRGGSRDALLLTRKKNTPLSHARTPRARTQISYAPDLGHHQEYVVGTGGVFNLYTALTGEKLPGSCRMVAQGNTLGKGPQLLRFPQRGLELLRKLVRRVVLFLFDYVPRARDGLKRP